MGKINKQRPVKLIAGLITSYGNTYKKAKKLLVACFGAIDYESSELAFDYTDYYEEELGKGLRRHFISFKKLIPPQRLSVIKVKTNKLEEKLSVKNKRKINIDPGYITEAKLILATTKDYKHRIYLNKGIYAEVTLNFSGNTFSALEWTYPDYRTKDYIGIFNHIRKIYTQQLKCTRHI